MTIRITPTFRARRVGSLVFATIIDAEDFPASATLTASQCRDAAEAFNVLAVMLEAAGDDSDHYPQQDREASAADRAYQMAKEDTA